MPQCARPSDKWGPGLRKLVLAFSDTQLVTGIAILAGAFSQLRCGIQAYSWQIVVYLAWFSSCTHMSTLTVLRSYFREHRVLRISRLIGMLITVVMLIVALVPTASQNWEYSQSSRPSTFPALCYYKWITSEPFIPGAFYHEDKPYFAFNGAISICYLGISYSIRALKLSETGSKWVRDWLRTKPSEVTQNCLRQLSDFSRDGKFRLIWALAYEALLICFVYCRATADLFGSMF
jgi:cytochrome c oxidase subunit IV